MLPGSCCALVLALFRAEFEVFVKPSGRVERNAFLQALPGRLSMQNSVAMPLILMAWRLAIRRAAQGPETHQGIKSSGGHGRPSRQCGMTTTANCRDITLYRWRPNAPIRSRAPG